MRSRHDSTAPASSASESWESEVTCRGAATITSWEPSAGWERNSSTWPRVAAPSGSIELAKPVSRVLTGTGSASLGRPTTG
jgi:hypothetical protein